MKKNKALIEFNGLVTEFHTEGSTLRAVDNISFTLNKGETIGVVGESGSGKSSISKCIIGYYDNYIGLIKYKGVNIKSYGRKFLSKEIQLIFQDPYSSLDPKIKVVNHIQQILKFHFSCFL